SRPDPYGARVERRDPRYGKEDPAFHTGSTPSTHRSGSWVCCTKLHDPSPVVRCPPCGPLETRRANIGSQRDAVVLASSPCGSRRNVGGQDQRWRPVVHPGALLGP